MNPTLPHIEERFFRRILMLVDALKCFVAVAAITLATVITAWAGETVAVFDISEQENMFEQRSLLLKAVSEALVLIPQEVITLKQTMEPDVDENFNLTFGIEYGIDMEKYNALCAQLFAALDGTGAVNLGKYLGGNDDTFKIILYNPNYNDDSGWKGKDDVAGLSQALKAYRASREADAEKLSQHGSLVAVCVWRKANRESAWKVYIVPPDVMSIFINDLSEIRCKAVFRYEGAGGAGKTLCSSDVFISQGGRGSCTISPGILLRDTTSPFFSVGPGKLAMQYTVNLPEEELREMIGITIELQRNRK